MFLQTGLCAYLTITLERDYRQPFTYNFAAAVAGTKTGQVGKTILGTINKSLSIMSKADDFRLKIGGKSPYPYSLLSYRWTGRVIMLAINKHGLISPTTRADIIELHHTARFADIREVEDISGESVYDNLKYAFKHANPCLTARTHNHKLLGIFGLIPLQSDTSAIAFIGTDAITTHKIAFLRGARACLDYLQSLPHGCFLTNVVDCRNVVHIKFLEYLGFHIHEHITAYGAAQIPVMKFWNFPKSP